MIKGKLRILNDGMILFWCKGCKSYHGVYVDKNKPVHWEFNNDYDKPTFNPSVLVKTGHYEDGHNGKCWCDYAKEHPDDDRLYKCGICHSFVRDGKIQYLNDCTHELAGQTVDLESAEE
jgi:hypothetical protein